MQHFNPLAPCGARLRGAERDARGREFQSTRPVRGETCPRPHRYPQHRISIHSPRAGRDAEELAVIIPIPISIHSPRAGRDAQRPSRPSGKPNFNPLAPCGARLAAERKTAAFLCISIHSPRAGRDTTPTTRSTCRRYFNPLAPCGARLRAASHRGDLDLISIHSPRAGRDFDVQIVDDKALVFQSTRPVRGETWSA